MGVIATAPLAVGKLWVWSAASAGIVNAVVNNRAVMVFSMDVSLRMRSGFGGRSIAQPGNRKRRAARLFAPLFIGRRLTGPQTRRPLSPLESVTWFSRGPMRKTLFSVLAFGI